MIFLFSNCQSIDNKKEDTIIITDDTKSYQSIDNKNIDDKNENTITITDKTKIDRHFLSRINDTLVVEKINNEVCFNINFDSCAKQKPLEMFELIDFTHSKVLINWHPFLGTLKTTRVAENVFQFTGESYLPKLQNSKWSNDFERQKIIKYTLEIKENAYSFYQNIEDRLKLPYNEKRIKEIESYFTNNPDCKSEDWYIANSCFEIIQEYEFLLFSSLISGELKYKNKYLNLKEDISIVNAGVYSQYLEGNHMLLALYGIVSFREYDLSVLYILDTWGKKVKHCY